MIVHNGNIVVNNGRWINPPPPPEPDPYNPLNLPPNTVRVRVNDGNVPYKMSYTTYETATLVSGTSDVYDVYKSGTDFRNLLYGSRNVIEVLGANTSNITYMLYMLRNCKSLTNVALFDTSNVTSMYGMFWGCSALQSVPLFDTSKVIEMEWMFGECTTLQSVPLYNTSKVTSMYGMFNGSSALKSVPLFDTSNVTTMEWMFHSCTTLQSVPLYNTSKVTNMNYMLWDCTNVQSGALALYQQASTQTNPPTSHDSTFKNCGKNTTTGSAELAQIPSDWK